MFSRIISLFTVSILLAACVQPLAKKDYTGFRNANLKSLLIVPAVNRSLQVTAPDYYLSTISVPLAERGYYVFPVHLVKRVMEEDGMSDADMIHNQDPVKLASLFNADAVLYVTIEKWESRYAILSTTTEVEINYVIKDGSTGEELWTYKQSMVYQPAQNSNGLAGLIVNAITAAIEKAAPNYMPLARKVNSLAILTPHQGIPAGPYAKTYKKDFDKF
jgi:hypothetical protein